MHVPNQMAFEPRGVTLELMEALVHAGEHFQQCPRVLMKDGTTAVQLASHDDDAPLTPNKTAEEIASLVEAVGDTALFRRIAAIVRSSGFDQAAILRFSSVSECVDVIAERAGAADISGVPLARLAVLVGQLRRGQRMTVQRRTISQNRVQRSMAKVDAAEIVGRLPVAVGERVRPPGRPIGTTATVTDYDPVRCVFTLTHCTIPALFHECNYTLVFASGATIEVSHDEIERDPFFTTKDACEELVKPMTQASLCSLVELMASGPSIADTIVHGPAACACATMMTTSVGVSTDFASHAWKYRFKSLVFAIANHVAVEGLDPTDTFFWLDIATVNQHPEAQATLPPDYFYTTFRDGISAIGRTVLVLSPWADPIPLTRSWCLWEITCTYTCGAQLSVVLSPNEVENFEAALGEDFERVETVMSTIDVSRSEAFLVADQERILAAAHGVAGGVEMLNTDLKNQLREWLSVCARRLADRLMVDAPRSGGTVADSTADNSAATNFDAQLKVSVLLEGVAKLMTALSRPTESLTLHRRALELRTSTLSATAPLTLTSAFNVATMLVVQNEIAAATSLHEETLQLRQETLGEDHADTLASYSAMGGLRHIQSRFAESEALYRRAINGQRKILGDADPSLYITIAGLAAVMSGTGRASEAEELFMEVLAGCTRTLGWKHAQTLIWRLQRGGRQLGNAAMDRDERLELEAGLRETLADCREMLGATHDLTQGAARVLQASMQAGGRTEESLVILTEMRAALQRDMRKQADMWGSTHVRTIATARALIDNLKASQDFAGATALMRHVLAGRESSLGVAHSLTMQAKFELATWLHGRGHNEEAVVLLRSLHKQREDWLGPTHVDTTLTLRTLVAAVRVTDSGAALPLMERLTEDSKEAARASNSALAHMNAVQDAVQLILVLREHNRGEAATDLTNATLTGMKAAIEEPEMQLARQLVPCLEMMLRAP